MLEIDIAYICTAIIEDVKERFKNETLRDQNELKFRHNAYDIEMMYQLNNTTVFERCWIGVYKEGKEIKFCLIGHNHNPNQKPYLFHIVLSNLIDRLDNDKEKSLREVRQDEKNATWERQY